MSLCPNCSKSLFTTRIPDDPSVLLEKLRWESGPASFPNPEEVLPILHSAQQELEDYEMQIKALESRRKSLRVYTEQLQSLMSPCRKVPDEILQHIFDYCCHMNLLGHFGPAKTRSAITDLPALTLSSVCLRWRRNGLSMPSIWSRISMACQRTHEEEDRKFLSTLNIFLDRAQQHPLTITLEAVENSYSQEPKLTLLFNHMHRWCSFSYRPQSDSFHRLILGRPLGSRNFPLLEELDMANMDEEDLSIFTQAAPKLKKLSALIPSDPFQVKNPLFTQLSHLEFYYPFAHEIQTLMDSNYHLVSLKTEESVSLRSVSGSEEPPSPTLCRTIDTLTLFHEPTAWKDHSVLPYLTLPSLKNIHLERNALRERQVRPHIRRSDWRNFDPFMAFLSRSSCSLTTLFIESLALADSKLIDLLTHIPTLLDFSINDSYVLPTQSPITGRFIESLRATSHPPIVPRLHSLKLDVGAITFEDGSVVDMVRSRWIPGRRSSEQLEPRVECLRELTIKFRNRNEIQGVYQPLEDMDRDGMRVVVLWQNSEGSELKE
ncbi:hypothetical protein BT96DRAFT_926267 [Gymnopus androsaceus JB14]|uniref:Uncharacterized protein n=1 Tax=Gymnopus androsaceus JB14 TaxID=1447944 RepID=A0A6A4GVL9_9AGAR|nr:hypothetical protein BT96DRAFT_926267 [Gymnopus androsaceus JB14]